MTKEQAETAITLSALVTTGMFAYRKVTEPEAPSITNPKLLEDYKSLVGAAPPIEWGQFLKGAGSAYIVIAIIGAISPPIGGGLAVLVGAGAFLGNAVAIRKDLASTGYQESLAANEAIRVASGVGLPEPLPKVRALPTTAPIGRTNVHVTGSGQLH